MLHSQTDPLQHSHTFGQEQEREGERRTFLVIGITLATMAVEILAGLKFGSMALLADGLHMASHSAALAITAFAYVYSRKNAADPRFSFGTGKVNALGGFTGALLLAGFAVMMAWESIDRLIHPVTIAFNWAIGVAFVGLVVNAASMLILGHHGHSHSHSHGTDESDTDHGHPHDHGEDHNLRSAYFHVMADALTSVTAIVALFTAKFFGWIWMDPLMGIIGSLLVASWSFGLIKSTSRILLDHQAAPAKLEALRQAMESDSDRVTDLHMWSIGPGIHSAVVTISSLSPEAPQAYKERIPEQLGIVHATVEVHQAPDSD